MALQMAAYANADYILRLVEPEPVVGKVEEPKLEKVDFPDISGAVVLHLRPDESALHPVSIRPEVFEMFLTLLEVRKWDKDLSKTVLGNPIEV